MRSERWTNQLFGLVWYGSLQPLLTFPMGGRPKLVGSLMGHDFKVCWGVRIETYVSNQTRKRLLMTLKDWWSAAVMNWVGQKWMPNSSTIIFEFSELLGPSLARMIRCLVWHIFVMEISFNQHQESSSIIIRLGTNLLKEALTCYELSRFVSRSLAYKAYTIIVSPGSLDLFAS